jgi:3-(3-hydroxy-phenyl)propionate hydroxylase
MSTPFANTAFVNGYEFTQGTGYTLPEYPFVVPEEVSTGHINAHPIVIVGGGITGLTLACALAQLGVKAVLLDEDNTVGVKGASSRGICYTQKSLEIFHKLGIYERIAAKGIQWSVGRTFAGDDEVYAFDLAQQSAYNLSSQPPFTNIQQFYIEGFLVERILALGHVDIRWNNRVTAFTPAPPAGDEFATLSIATPAGEYRLKAQYVIDATGAHSPFRGWCKASVTAKKGDDRWCIADVRFTHRPPTERHTWIEAPFNENRAVWQHLMADDVWRIDYQMAPNADPAAVSREDVVRERLARQFGPDAGVDIVWVGPYAYKSECIDQMRHGAVFFMGDSAKVVSPFGARGGNTGVADADNLAWKLACVLRGQAAPRLLDSYHEERHEAARENVQVTNRTARFLRPADGMERVFRSAVIALAKRHAFAQKFVNTGRMAVANSYQFSSCCSISGKGHGGISLQNIAFQWSAQQTPPAPSGVVNDLLRWADGRLLLLAFGTLSAAALQHLRTLSTHASVVSVQVLDTQTPPQAREHLIDCNSKGANLLRLACQNPAWALVRPDGYLAATGTALNGSLVHALQKALGM